MQLFVAELSFDRAGNVLGVEREFQLTDNQHVNWAPYWHPNGRYLIYATSELGHKNYEVFVIDADAGGDGATTHYGTRKRRITHADKFDGLPVFNHDGARMMWTSQRSPAGVSQVWIADFVMQLDRIEGESVEAQAPAETPARDRLEVLDPDSGLYFLYDPATHELSVYDPKTHAVRAAKEDEAARAMKLFRDR